MDEPHTRRVRCQSIGCSRERGLPKSGSNGAWSGWQMVPTGGVVFVTRKFVTASSMQTLASASLVCPYPSSVSKTALPSRRDASTELAYFVLGSYLLPMTRIGFAVVAVHGPVNRSALRACQEAQGAQSHQPSADPRKLVVVRCCMTLGQVRDRAGQLQEGLIKRTAGAVANTRAVSKAGSRISRKLISRSDPSLSATWFPACPAKFWATRPHGKRQPDHRLRVAVAQRVRRRRSRCRDRPLM